MSRYLVAFLLGVAAGVAVAAPVKPVVPCESTVLVFGDATVLARGVRAPGSTDLVARMKTFFGRVCGGQSRFETIARGGGTLVDDVTLIVDRLARTPRSIALVHFPFADIESGSSVDDLIRVYGTILRVCEASGSLCIIGGQQPVESFSQKEVDRQSELEGRGSAAYGANYLPLYRYFQSESSVRRLMVRFDSGDGRHLDDRGHDLLFEIFRRRLLELARARV